MSEKSLSESQLEKIAASLHEAEQTRTPLETPLTETWPELTLPDAYRIQKINMDNRVKAGEKLLGHKVGLTAKIMQELFGVNEPDYGQLLDTMFIDEATPINLSEFVDPQIEVEPAFVLAKPLSGPNLTIDDVMAATDYISICFELIDSRILNWNIKIQDTVADNGSSSRVIMGTKKIKPGQFALDDLETVLEIDGETVQTGNTSAILGHPANGVAWLGNKLAEFGQSFEAGHTILPGTCTRSVRIGGHKVITGKIDKLGEVTVQLTGTPTITNKS